MSRQFEDRINRLFEDFNNADEINDNNLESILKDNINTEFGRKYRFEDIHSIEEFRRRVPLTSAQDYPNGNSYSYEVGYNLATSGTLGKRKRFTVSSLAMSLSGGYNYEMPFYLLDMPTDKGMNISIFNVADKDMLLSAALYDTAYKCGSFRLEDFYDKDLLFSDTVKNIPYIKSYIALAHEDIRYFCSIFLYDLLIIFNYMKENWKQLLHDIRNHSFSVELSERDKALLLKQDFSDERLADIERIFTTDSDEPLMKRLFPELRFVSGVGGGKYEVFDRDLKTLIGEDTDIFYYIYAQTECTMGIPVKMNEASYAMMPRMAFYEYYDAYADEVLLPHELVVGNEYEPIVTTFSGIYRYHTGDRVRVKEFLGETPVVTIHGRINSIINIAGEKVDDADITLVMDKMKEHYSFSQFAVGIDASVYPNRYVIFVDALDANEEFAVIFDRELKKMAFDYEDLRDRGDIGLPILHKMNTESFLKIQKGQIKPKVVVSNKQVQEWMSGR